MIRTTVPIAEEPRRPTWRCKVLVLGWVSVKARMRECSEESGLLSLPSAVLWVGGVAVMVWIRAPVGRASSMLVKGGSGRMSCLSIQSTEVSEREAMSSR